MSDNQVCCAHCKVILKHNEHPGGTRSDYWECADGCGTKFWPEIVSERIKKDYEYMVYNWRESEDGYNEMDRRRLAAEKEVERLKRGEFTREEFQNLCHNRHEKPGCTAQDFFDGCAAFQKSMFGHSEREDKTPT